MRDASQMTLYELKSYTHAEKKAIREFLIFGFANPEEEELLNSIDSKDKVAHTARGWMWVGYATKFREPI